MRRVVPDQPALVPPRLGLAVADRVGRGQDVGRPVAPVGDVGVDDDTVLGLVDVVGRREVVRARPARGGGPGALVERPDPDLLIGGAGGPGRGGDLSENKRRGEKLLFMGGLLVEQALGESRLSYHLP